MTRRKDGTVQMELNQASWDKGYTMRSGINPDAIRAFKRWNKDSAAIIRDAMRRGDSKAIIAEMQNAKWRNHWIRDAAEHHDKIVYDAAGNSVMWWDYKSTNPVLKIAHSEFCKVSVLYFLDVKIYTFRSHKSRTNVLHKYLKWRSQESCRV